MVQAVRGHSEGGRGTVRTGTGPSRFSPSATCPDDALLSRRRSCGVALDGAADGQVGNRHPSFDLSVERAVVSDAALQSVSTQLCRQTSRPRRRRNAVRHMSRRRPSCRDDAPAASRPTAQPAARSVTVTRQFDLSVERAVVSDATFQSVSTQLCRSRPDRGVVGTPSATCRDDAVGEKVAAGRMRVIAGEWWPQRPKFPHKIITSRNSATTSRRSSTLCSSTMGANAGLMGDNVTRECRHSPSSTACFSLE